MSPNPPALKQRQRGAAALLVVMMLFFIMMLVTAYASRSLISEQRTSANQYRSTQAFEAAEAGLQWTLAMLNSGNVDAACAPLADDANNSFRQRYLAADLHTSTFRPVANPSPDDSTLTVRPGCVREGDQWTCSCPAGGNAAIVQPEADGSHPAFTIEIGEVLIPGTTDRWPGVIGVVSRGCSAVGTQCVMSATDGRSDAYVEVRMKAALVRALKTQPTAALTTRGAVNLATAWRIVNTDTGTGGITIVAGEGVNAPDADIESMPGAPGDAMVVDHDDTLAAIDAARYLNHYAGLDGATFRMLPTVARIDCADPCGQALADAWRRGVRMFHVTGAMTVEAEAGTPLVLGTPDQPVMIVAEGDISFSGPIQMVGFLYGHRLDWSATGANDARVVGAVALRDSCCGGNGTPLIQYEPEVLARLSRISGTFARIDGSWKDY